MIEDSKIISKLYTLKSCMVKVRRQGGMLTIWQGKQGLRIMRYLRINYENIFTNYLQITRKTENVIFNGQIQTGE